MLARAEFALKDAKFLELRLDLLPNPSAVLPQLKEFLATRREATVIATCRRKQFGGGFEGSLKAELDVLTGAVEAGCQIVDLEIESAEEAAPRQLDALRDGLRAAGWAIAETPGPIIRLLPLEAPQVAALKSKLLAAGIYPPFLKYPGGSAKGIFRFVISSGHQRRQLERLVSVLTGWNGVITRQK